MRVKCVYVCVCVIHECDVCDGRVRIAIISERVYMHAYVCDAVRGVMRAVRCLMFDLSCVKCAGLWVRVFVDAYVS